MAKTQIQLPPELYQQIKRVAGQRGWSLAEVLRRGAEYMVRVYPPRQQSWRPPEPVDLGGVPLVQHTQWRELANEPDIEERSS